MPEPGELVFAAPRRAKPPRHLADLSPAERESVVVELGHPAFRARQLSTHYFGRLADSAAAMTDLPAASRQVLADALMPALVTAVREVSCDDGATRKTVWRLFDGTLVESVLMRYFGPSGRGELGDEADADRLATRESTTRGRDRVTVCVSSQAGCGMNCPFCATGQAGLTRNLSAAEIVEQVVAAARSMARGEIPGESAGCRTWSSWAWANRWRTTTRCSAPSAVLLTLPLTASGCRSAASQCRPSGWCRRSTS